MEILLIIISAVFVNNVVLAQFLGICPFLGVSNKLSTATGMSAAVCFVITLATLVTFLLNNYVLQPLELEFLQTISFILVIAALVQMVEIVLKKVSPSLYQALGIFLPLITTNCTVLGVAITVVTVDQSWNTSRRMIDFIKSFLRKQLLLASGIVQVTANVFFTFRPIQVRKYTVHINTLADCRVTLKFQFC